MLVARRRAVDAGAADDRPVLGLTQDERPRQSSPRGPREMRLTPRPTRRDPNEVIPGGPFPIAVPEPMSNT